MWEINGEMAAQELTHFKIGKSLFLNEACYAWFDGEEDTLYDEPITVFFFPMSIKHRNFVDWVINKSEFAHYYITKDVKEGFKSGFRVRWKGDYEEFINALRIIRMTNEFHLPLKPRLDEYSNSTGIHQYVKAILSFISTPEGGAHVPSGNNSFTKHVNTSQPINKFKETIKCVV